MRWVMTENGIELDMPTADELLQDICDIGFDYDGFNTVESLKELIDELVEMAMEARKCLRRGRIFPDENNH